MHERFFANPRNLTPAELPGHATAVGLDSPKFQACLESGRHTGRVRRDLADGQKAGVRGTPTFFLGLAEADGTKVRVVKMIRGAQSFAGFKTAIDAALAAQK